MTVISNIEELERLADTANKYQDELRHIRRYTGPRCIVCRCIDPPYRAMYRSEKCLDWCGPDYFCDDHIAAAIDIFAHGFKELRISAK